MCPSVLSVYYPTRLLIPTAGEGHKAAKSKVREERVAGISKVRPGGVAEAQDNGPLSKNNSRIRVAASQALQHRTDTTATPCYAGCP